MMAPGGTTDGYEQIPPEAQQKSGETGPRRACPGVFDAAFLTGVEGVTEVIFVRHGQPHVNFEGAIGDTIDPPLSDHGRMQANPHRRGASTNHVDAVFASPLKRAMADRRAIAAHH